MDVTLTVETGRPTGTAAARRLREEGRVPGVVYGLSTEARSVSVAWPELRRALSTDAGQNALISLTVDGNTHLSMVKDLNRHPVRRTVEHVDFLLIDPDQPLSVEVPIILEGEAPKVDAQKGMIDQLMYTLPIKARPDAIPTQVEADVSHLEIGTALRVSEIPLPDGVTADVDGEEPVAQGSPTRSTVIMQQEAARQARIAAGEATEEDLAIEAGELTAEQVADGASASGASSGGDGGGDGADES
ncbi:MAG: 50S ribosomal protein L25 [Acidimicrobiia bacterium]|nr:50S ribosomal protein L25 [Acidimicrobiia bacterium]